MEGTSDAIRTDHITRVAETLLFATDDIDVAASIGDVTVLACAGRRRCVKLRERDRKKKKSSQTD